MKTTMTKPKSPPVQTGRSVSLVVRVRYAETDQMQRVYYGRYFEWFEAARGEYCRQNGISYAEIERERGLYIPVLDAHCKYIAPALYDDEVRIETFVIERKSRTLKIGYKLYIADKLIAEGDTVHILVNGAGRPCVWPPDLAACFSPASKAEADRLSEPHKKS